ncbi:MAG: enoyl-CoA hydratase-related protein [Haloferacaceae archaeon]|jgi:enoyl-CoA hydratase
MTVRVAVADGVARLTVDRPDARNALDRTTRDDLLAALDDLEADGSGARVVVITGSDGSGAFVSGADLGELRERTAEEQRAEMAFPRLYERVATCRWPTVARVNGYALGGGCELALACDIRVASTEARLGQPEITLGMMPGGGGTQRLPRLVGPGRAAELALTGEAVDAERAAEIGLVLDAVPPEELDDRVAALADRIAAHAPGAVEATVDALRASERLPLDEGLRYERERFLEVFAHENRREGIDAFREDREPSWD